MHRAKQNPLKTPPSNNVRPKQLHKRAEKKNMTFIHSSNPPQEFNEIVLIKSFIDLEGKYIDYLSVLAEKKIVPVDSHVEDPMNKDEHLKIIDWLNKKDVPSTVFVSFGSERFLSKDKIKELAHGLEFSKVSFGRENYVSETLPEGFLLRSDSGTKTSILYE
ncbi:hypothetical protein HYC85_016803 [Camellia sinensis]|uniref:Uncharacterized protein n=1 Tax=Camellia sinensis TaxID=4442 RepID=A0A7J7H1X1_CAMSI|nr:hypothetical protein HYC85_016803 [Camellia sinensis]